MKLFFLVITILVTQITYAGTETGNGGHPCAGKIMRHAKTIFNAIKNESFYIENLDLKALKEKIDTAEVRITKEQIEIEDWTRHGQAFLEENAVEFWVGVCDLYYNYSSELMILILHEFINLTDSKIDKNFQLSGALHEITGVPAYSMGHGVFSNEVVLLYHLAYFSKLSDEQNLILTTDNYQHANNKILFKVNCLNSSTGDVEVIDVLDNQSYSKGTFKFDTKQECLKHKNIMSMINMIHGKWIKFFLNTRTMTVELIQL